MRRSPYDILPMSVTTEGFAELYSDHMPQSTELILPQVSGKLGVVTYNVCLTGPYLVYGPDNENQLVRTAAMEAARVERLLAALNKIVADDRYDVIALQEVTAAGDRETMPVHWQRFLAGVDSIGGWKVVFGERQGAVLYRESTLEQQELATVAADTGAATDEEAKGDDTGSVLSKVQTVSLKHRACGTAFLLHNAYFPHQADPAVTEGWLGEVFKAFPGCLNYVVGDFNARISPLDSRPQHNGTNTNVPFGQGYDHTDGFFALTGNQIIQHPGSVLDPRTGGVIERPAVTLVEAQSEKYFQRVLLEGNHQLMLGGKATAFGALAAAFRGAFDEGVSDLHLMKNMCNLQRIDFRATSQKLISCLQLLGIFPGVNGVYSLDLHNDDHNFFLQVVNSKALHSDGPWAAFTLQVQAGELVTRKNTKAVWPPKLRELKKAIQGDGQRELIAAMTLQLLDHTSPENVSAYFRVADRMAGTQSIGKQKVARAMLLLGVLLGIGAAVSKAAFSVDWVSTVFIGLAVASGVALVASLAIGCSGRRKGTSKAAYNLAEALSAQSTVSRTSRNAGAGMGAATAAEEPLLPTGEGAELTKAELAV